MDKELPSSLTMELQKNINNLEDGEDQCDTSNPVEDFSKEIELNDTLDPELLIKWPKPLMRIPSILLHKTVDLAQHALALLTQNIRFYQPYLGTNYTRISCLSFDDHKAMLEYFETNDLPFHTFGHPTERVMKVVIRGLEKDIDLEKFSIALQSAGIPVRRVHKMHMSLFVKNKDFPVLVVVPNSTEGRKLLLLKKAFGEEVILERPLRKTRQCFRCQKWGHAQRYCHGEVRCVKCAGEHYYDRCTRDREKEPPTCSNCGGNHTASYRECFYCPDSTEYKRNRKHKMKKEQEIIPQQERVLVTLENYETALYKAVKNIPRHTEAVPF